MIPSSDTPVLVQAALLPIELSKPTYSPAGHHQPPEAGPERAQPLVAERPRPAALTGPPAPFPAAYPPSAFGPPPQFSPPARLASVDHTTIPPPPATVQEPVTSAPYGGGQPPARAANPQMVAYPTPQTPPYCNPLSNSPQTFPQTQPYSQPPCPSQQQPDDRQTPPQPVYMQARNPSYPQPSAQPLNQSVQPPNQSAQPLSQPVQPLNQSTQPLNQYAQPLSQSGQPLSQPAQPMNQPTPQPRPRPQNPPQPGALPQPSTSPQSPTQSRTQHPPPANPPRSPISSSRISESGARNSTIPQPYSSARITTYPPARPVLPMPKPPPHLLNILQQQEEQRKQQHFFLLQQQLQSMQHQIIEEGQQQRYQSEAPRQRASTVDSRPGDLERDSDDTETQSNDTSRPSLKQRPRLNKRIVTVSPHRATPPAQANSQPANSSPSTTTATSGANTNPNQRICTVPPHPYGTIIPRFSTQHAFNVSHSLPSQALPNQGLQTHVNRGSVAYSSQPPPRPDYLQNPLPGPTVTRPVNSNLGASYYPNTASKPPETTTRNTICQTDSIIEEYTSRSQACPAKHEPDVRDAPSLSPVSEPLSHSAQPSQSSSESQQPAQQTQGIQARLSHAQPLHSPALQTTHVMGSIQMIQNSQVKYSECAQVKQDDFYVPVQQPNYSMQSANRTSFSERNSGQSLLQQQQQSFQMQQWQQQRQTPSPQYIQLGTFPPSMAAFARPPSGGFVQSITERPLKLSLPSQVQTTQLYPQNFSNVGVGIRSANSCPGDVRIGAFHPGLMHAHRPGSPHHPRARSAGRVSVSESTASVWGSSSNPHHLP